MREYTTTCENSSVSLLGLATCVEEPVPKKPGDIAEEFDPRDGALAQVVMT